MRHLLFTVLFAVGCTSSDPLGSVTIHQGVYGLTWTSCDSGTCQDQRISTDVVARPSSGMASSTKSDGDGVFQLELPAGTYMLCTYSCVSISIAAGELLRRDYFAGPGGGVWCTDSTCSAP